MSRARYRRRDPLARDRADMADAARKHYQPPPMTPDEIEAGMRRVILKKLETGEPISLEDFRLAYLPVKEVEPRFRRVLAAVQNELAMER